MYQVLLAAFAFPHSTSTKLVISWISRSFVIVTEKA